MKPKFSGLVVPMVTPFRDDESLDEQALRRLCDYLIDAGTHAVFPAGSTGECYALTRAEWTRVVSVVVEHTAGRVPVFAGTSAISTSEAVDLAREAERIGADAVVALTPFYISPTQHELYHHFRTIADSIELPLLPYNNPMRTGVNLTAETVARLAEVANIAGIKDSSGNLALTNEFVSAVPPGFGVFQGQDGLIAASLNAGAAGAVAATANVAPHLLVSLYRAFQSRDMRACNEAQRKIAVLRRSLQLATFPVVFKEAMAMLGVPVGPARRPCSPLDVDGREQLRETLEKIGLTERPTASVPSHTW